MKGINENKPGFGPSPIPVAKPDPMEVFFRVLAILLALGPELDDVYRIAARMASDPFAR